MVEIGVVDGLQTNQFGHRPVVGPARIGNEDAAARTGAAQDVHQDRERAGAARAVDAADALQIDHAAKGQIDYRSGEFLVADDALVDLGLGGIENALLGLADGAQHGRDALGVLVDADAEVDLAVARIGSVLGHEDENLVERGLLEGLKHRSFPGKSEARSL